MSLDAEYQERVPEGAIFLEVMIEDENYQPCDLEDLQRWTNQYHLTMPVLSDPNSSTMWSFASGQGSVGLPYTILIDHGAVIESTNYPTTADLDALLAE